MMGNPRREHIVDEIKRQGPMSVEQLAQRFGVTLQTVRRDIKQLAEIGVLTRYHGGVRLPESTTENITYLKRRQLNEDAKRAIAQTVAKAIPDGCSLILNIGTTTEAIARELVRHRGLRVITNNLNVAAILADNTSCEVIVAGGVVRSLDHGIVGEAAVDFVRQFRVDIAVIGISGIEKDGSLRDFDLREVKVAQAIIAQSREVWLAADHSKFHRQAMVELAQINQINCVFTDKHPPEPFPALLREAGVECVVADL